MIMMIITTTATTTIIIMTMMIYNDDNNNNNNMNDNKNGDNINIVWGPNELSREMCPHIRSFIDKKKELFWNLRPLGYCQSKVYIYIYFIHFKPSKQTYYFHGTKRLITLHKERRFSTQLMISFVSTLKSLSINAQRTCKFRDLMRLWYAYLLSQAV